MSSWKRKIEETLRNGMRFCFSELPTGFQEAEFKGTSSFGLLDQVVADVNEERKRCFIAAYVMGAQDAFEDCKQVTKVEGEIPEFSDALSQVTGERRFQVWDR